MLELTGVIKSVICLFIVMRKTITLLKNSVTKHCLADVLGIIEVWNIVKEYWKSFGIFPVEVGVATSELWVLILLNEKILIIKKKFCHIKFDYLSLRKSDFYE